MHICGLDYPRSRLARPLETILKSVCSHSLIRNRISLVLLLVEERLIVIDLEEGVLGSFLVEVVAISLEVSLIRDGDVEEGKQRHSRHYVVDVYGEVQAHCRRQCRVNAGPDHHQSGDEETGERVEGLDEAEEH